MDEFYPIKQKKNNKKVDKMCNLITKCEYLFLTKIVNKPDQRSNEIDTVAKLTSF